ncbi:TRAP transporter substrate-binding protein [Bacillus sp. Marseille-Q3570]|uniref:TRAP transporter substrate-binding protein n=1 Tax=Bacillus sp. Marseille-Q3570 TaxID=2963522 RepID=UPI0021B82EED|nr:TRAP transporter substrate-binding protein [Bacillus sp. Marseille-Q3570]
MKKWKRTIAGLVSASILVLGACSAGQTTSGGESGIQERTIKAGIGLNEDHPEGQALLKFKEIVEEKTDGKIKVQTYFASQLGDDLQMTEALKSGTQEVTIPSTSPLVGMVKEFGLFDFPFLFNSEEEADAVLDGEVGQAILEKLPEHNLVGLAYWENGFRNITNSKHPIETAEDFAGLKIRTMQNEVHLEAFQKMGANPTPMAFSEVFTALESKTVDGQENPLATIESNKFYEVQDYLSVTNHVYTPFVFLMSKTFWDKLSDEEKKIMEDAAVEAGKYNREINRKANEESLQNLKDQGMEVNEFSNEEKEKVQEQIQPVIDKFAEKFGEDLFKQMTDQLEELRQ